MQKHHARTPLAFISNATLNLDKSLLTLLALVLLLALSVQLVTLLVSPVYAPPRAQTELLNLSVAQPGMQVRVIVQTVQQGETDASQQKARVEQFTRELGGQVLDDLGSRNAFVAQLPAGRAQELARHVGVYWVSLA